ncbi:MAG: hypothetical protein KatS3mg068_1003 [Candidatus Sericytochromatia bacterium]|nr:MAG: hypothetical protein KatS3mg068_1003 [Candidatus Sericytochromatia bacterium]
MEEKLKFYKTDSRGNIINNIDVTNLIKEYKPLLDEVTNVLKENYPDEFLSLFLNADLLKKDKNKILLLVITNSVIDLIWLDEFKIYLSNKYSCNINILFQKYSKIKEEEELLFQLKLKYAFISGKNITSDVNYKIDDRLLFYTKNYKKVLKSIIKFISDTNTNSDNVKFYCKSFMAHFLLMGFELCLLKEKKYTDDIYTCYKVFCKYYPEYKKYIDEIYNLFKNPIGDKNQLIEFISNFPQWIILNFRIINSEKKLESFKKELCRKQL